MKEYRIKYSHHFFFLQEKRKWWIFPYWETLQYSHDFTLIENQFKKLQK